MKILLLSKYFPPEPGAGSTRAFEHAKRWKELGAEVTVLTCFPHYPDGIIPDKYKGHTFYKEEIEGINVIRTFTYAAPNKGKVKRSLGFFSFMFSSIIQGTYKVKKHDVLVASSPPITVGVSGMILSAIKRIPFVFEVRDLWPESIVQLGQITNKFVIKILEILEVMMYKRATAVVGISDPFVDIISRKGITEEKIKIIKNGVDLQLFTPGVYDENLADKLNLKGKFVAAYFGTFGLAHALDKVLLAASKLKDIEEIRFLFIGDGAEREKLKKMKEELKLTNVTFLPMIKKTELRKYYSIADLMLVPLRNLPLFDSALPSKLFEILAMKKPIIITVKGEAKKLVETAGVGKFAEPENPDDMAEKIKEAFNSPEWVKQAGERGRVFVEENFNRDKIAAEYLKLLEKTASKS
jgi:glycosyltransferase involved in cell wall biosynthesis